jgi:Flp pilus assembly protein TadB
MSAPATQDSAETPAQLPDFLPEHGTERRPIVRVALLVATAVLFLLAVVLWLVPVLTGIPFWILGFITLGMASRRAARWVNRHERRLPEKLRLALRPRLRRKLRQAGEPLPPRQSG